MKKIIIVGLMVISLLSSCVESIPLDIESEQKVVVNCILENENIQSLTLTYSKDIGGGIFYEPIQEATVQLLRNDTIIGEFSRTGNNKWEINHLPEFGATYKLLVSIPNRKDISALTHFPDKPNVRVNGESGHVKSFIQSNQLYSQWFFIMNSNFDSRWENPFVLPEIDDSDRLVENLATNHPAADRFNQYGNLSDLIGDESTLPAYDFYVRLNPINDTTEFDIEAKYSNQGFIVFQNTSDDYDKYLKSSFQKMRVYSDENDPISWFDENEVYSNIKNGVGIFGAYNETVVVFGKIIID